MGDVGLSCKEGVKVIVFAKHYSLPSQERQGCRPKLANFEVGFLKARESKSIFICSFNDSYEKLFLSLL